MLYKLMLFQPMIRSVADYYKSINPENDTVGRLFFALTVTFTKYLILVSQPADHTQALPTRRFACSKCSKQRTHLR